MKIQFDEKADAVYLRLDDSSIVESEEVHPGIVLDFNGANQVVGIESWASRTGYRSPR